MAELSTIARPYATAVFEIARTAKNYPAWSQQLHLLAAIVADAQMRSLIGNAAVTKEQAVKLIADVAGEKLDAKGRNLVKVLAEHRRLGVLAEISTQYEVLRAEAEATIDAEVVSAFAVDAAQQQSIAGALQKRLGRKVNITCKVDPALLGGAIVRAGNLVIDGSALGRLEKLATRLAHK
jgi:F-type H+-transporting ATPase subunit delta